MSIKASLIAFGIGALIVISGAYVVKHQIDQRVEAEVRASAEKTRADLAEQQLARVEQRLIEQHRRQAELVEKIQEARDREAQATEVLEDRDRLTRLTNAKPGLLERLARKATEKTWKDIEQDSRQ